MNEVILFFSILFLFGCVTTQKNKGNTNVDIEIIDYGIFEVEIEKKEIEKESVNGYVSKAINYDLLKETDLIIGKTNTIFGFTYVLSVSDKNIKSLPITYIIKHPLIKNPELQKEISIDKWIRDMGVGCLGFSGFMFEEDWEIEEGEWIFELWFNDKKLTEKKFIVERYSI